MNQWAMIRNGEIINIVTTERELSTLKQLDGPGIAFVPLGMVSQSVLESYRYWDERP